MKESIERLLKVLGITIVLGIAITIVYILAPIVTAFLALAVPAFIVTLIFIVAWKYLP